METLSQDHSEIGERNLVFEHTVSPRRLSISWGAIFAGLVAGVATQVILMLLGTALGLTAIHVTASGIGVKGAPVWAAAWNGLSMLIAAFVGGFVAARSSGLRRRMDGAIHGFVVWGATVILSAVLSTTAMAALLGGVFNSVNEIAASTVGQVDAETFFQQLRNMLERHTNINADALDSASLAEFQSLIVSGDRAGAISFLQVLLGVEQDVAAGIVDYALIYTGQPELASPQSVEAVKKDMRTASTALWLLFGVVLLAMLISMGGGLAGARNARREYHEQKPAPPGVET